MSLDAGTALKPSILYPARNFTLRAAAKACSVPIIILLVIAALGPENWAPRSGLGWQFDHVIGYFGITLFFCWAWPRPFLVGTVFMTVAALLECLQAFTPDRHFYVPAIFYGAAGALAAALVVELFVRAWRRWHLEVLGSPNKPDQVGLLRYSASGVHATKRLRATTP